MGKIRILIADDHAVLRAGLRMLINAQPDMEVVGEAGEGRETIKKVRLLRPDVVLLDLSMPGLGGLAALPILKARVPEAKVLILTMYDDESYLRQVLESGGSGYVVKKAADVELLTAVRAISRGELYVHSSMTRVLVEKVANKGGVRETGLVHLLEKLSEREQQVLRLLAHGYTNQQIADELFLSVKTIETYRARLMEKLKLRSRAELVKYALKKGLLSPAV